MSVVGIVPAGQPVITTFAENPKPLFFYYSIPPAAPGIKPFSHVVVFLNPGIQLPPGSAVAIYLATPPPLGQGEPVLRFLAGIGPGKESAIFKLAGTTPGVPTIIGIGIEDATEVARRMESRPATAPVAPTLAATPATTAAANPASTLVLAQRIGENAFNFLASCSTTIPGSSEEVIPMRAFKDWWRKFENRVRNDPGFLERPRD